MNRNPITIRSMTPADVPLGMRLKALAGWNQTAADWRLLLDTGAGFVALVDDMLAGTVTVVTYQNRFSWIGMLLVDPAYRRRGVGTALLKAAIEYARLFGPIYLDATPQGKPLYERLGFTSVGALVRMGRNCQLPVTGYQVPVASGQVTAIDEDMLATVARFDAMAFGASRAAVLHTLWRNAPQYAQCVIHAGKLMGYCLGRSGSNAEQIGPVVADNVNTARALLLAALGAYSGHGVIVDVPARQEAWREFLGNTGFVERRPFTRMVLGEPIALDQPNRQFAIAGPEMG